MTFCQRKSGGLVTTEMTSRGLCFKIVLIVLACVLISNHVLAHIFDRIIGVNTSIIIFPMSQRPEADRSTHCFMNRLFGATLRLCLWVWLWLGGTNELFFLKLLADHLIIAVLWRSCNAFFAVDFRRFSSINAHKRCINIARVRPGIIRLNNNSFRTALLWVESTSGVAFEIFSLLVNSKHSNRRPQRVSTLQ